VDQSTQTDRSDADEDLALTDFRDEEAQPEQLVGKPQTDIKEESEEQKTITQMSESKTAEMEQVMTSGMQFLAGLFKMSTGKELGLENQQIKINKETGEVTMTFKLPV